MDKKKVGKAKLTPEEGFLSPTFQCIPSSMSSQPKVWLHVKGNENFYIFIGHRMEIMNEQIDQKRYQVWHALLNVPNERYFL